MKSNFLFIIILQTGLVCQAQSVISITPMVGLQQLVSKQISKKNTANTFRNNAYDELFDSGIFLDYKRNKWAISIGYMSGNAGFVYKVSTPNLKQKKEGITHISTSVYALRRAPIKFSYTFKRFSLIPFAISSEDTRLYLDIEKARSKNLYLLNFKLIGFAALSYNWALSDSTSYSYSSESYNMYSGDIITFNNTITYLRKRNLSLMVGVTFQFMHQDKERMAITIYYNQGLSSIIQADLHYKINGESYNTSLAVKGSAIGINISYPFKLYDSGKRR